MKIGILGGTFDPIHIAHLITAEQVYHQLQLDQVWFMPAHIPPHKEGKHVTEAVHRLKMVELAIQSTSYFHAFPYELNRPGPSYTIETMKEIKNLYPNVDFYFIIGGDMIDYLPKWHKIDQLVNLVKFVGVHRPGYQPDNEWAKKYVKMVPMPQTEISSTLIRTYLKNGQSIRFMVPDEVEKYIEENHLYDI